jgi:hypothetical protein
MTSVDWGPAMEDAPVPVGPEDVDVRPGIPRYRVEANMISADRMTAEAK